MQVGKYSAGWPTLKSVRKISWKSQFLVNSQYIVHSVSIYFNMYSRSLWIHEYKERWKLCGPKLITILSIASNRNELYLNLHNVQTFQIFATHDITTSWIPTPPKKCQYVHLLKIPQRYNPPLIVLIGQPLTLDQGHEEGWWGGGNLIQWDKIRQRGGNLKNFGCKN